MSRNMPLTSFCFETHLRMRQSLIVCHEINQLTFSGIHRQFNKGHYKDALFKNPQYDPCSV